MWEAFALQKLLTFFQQKQIQHIWVSLDVNFNESLTNDVVSFEQLGPAILAHIYWRTAWFFSYRPTLASKPNIKQNASERGKYSEILLRN